MKLKVTVNGVVYDILVEAEEVVKPTNMPPVVIGGMPGLRPVPAPVAAAAAAGGAVSAPLAGSVTKVLVEVGQSVTAGQVLLIMEAMKMETEIQAPIDGKVSRIAVNPGDSVQAGEILIEIGEVSTGSEPTTAPASNATGVGTPVPAPLAGSITRVLTEVGQSVEPGTVLLVMEAMKMETEITAPVAGTVAGVLVEAGQVVQSGQVLLEIA